MPVMYNSFSPASSVILAMSSVEELVIAETFEEFSAMEAFEHLGEELADSRSMHFKQEGTNSSWDALFVEQVMNRAPSEDLHNSLLASQGLAFFEEIHKKASHDRIRECYDDFEGCQT